MWQYTYQDELYHYGVPGMKWGVRRAMKKEAKSYQKTLNKLDNESVKYISKYMKSDQIAKKYANKGAKYIQKHNENGTDRNAKKLNKITDKMTKAVQKRDAAQEKFKSLDSKTWKLIGEAANKGYTVNSKQVMKNAEKGRTLAQIALTGPLGNSAISLYRSSKYSGNYTTVDKRTGRQISQSPMAIAGNKYKVKAY